MSALKNFTDVLLVERLEKLVSLEKKTTVDILEVLREVDSRRLYLKMGFTSLFHYLTDGLGYPPASAQRRIESARLLRELPEISKDLADGSLNLTQVALFASGLRRLKMNPIGKMLNVAQKKEVLERIKEKNVLETQKILAKELDLPVLQQEKAHLQRDDSVRLEMTFSQDQMKVFKRVKELISHSNPNPTWSELLTFLGDEFLKRKDPLRKFARRKSTSAAEAAECQESSLKEVVPQVSENGIVSVSKSGGSLLVKPQRKNLSASLRRHIFKRDLCCQWRDPKTNRICGSKFQLQVDHLQPRWANGPDDPENLRLLCSVHNKMKYREETGTRFV